MLDVDGRALRRLRLERRGLRLGVRRSRADALRHEPRPTSRSRRVVGLSAGTDVELGGGITLRPVVSGEISQLWPEAQGLMPPEFGRDVDRLLVLELRRELDAGRSRAARRGRRARRRGDRAPARDRRRDRRRPRRLRAARLPAAADRAAPADRGDAAARRGDAARQDPRATRRGPARAAPARRRRPRARRGARPLGALALLGGAVPLRPGPRGAHLPARRRGGRVGRSDARRPCCSATSRPSACEVLESLRADRLRRDARDAVRRALVETLLHGDRATLVGGARRDDARRCGRGRRPCCAWPEFQLDKTWTEVSCDRAHRSLRLRRLAPAAGARGRWTALCAR